MANGQLDTLLKHVLALNAAEVAASLSDADLLERFITRREEAAFAALIRRHGPMVLAVCRRVLGHVQDAEDACQASFLVLARQAASIRKKGALSSWLHGVAYRVAAHLRKERARRRSHEGPAVDVPQPEGAEVTCREARAILDEELARLPEHYRAPLVLCYLEGKTRDEAAGHLGWNPGTFRGRLERARELLRRRLARRGVALSSAWLTTLGSLETTPAALPSALVAETARAALLGGSGVVTSPVAALAEGMLHAWAVSRLSIVAGVLLTVGFIGTGAGLLVSPISKAREASAKALTAADREPPPQAGKKQDAEQAPPDLAALIKALQSPDEKTRIQAAIKLGDLGPRAKAAVPALKEAVKKHLKTDYRCDVAVALWKIDRRTFKDILNGRSEGNQQYEVVTALGSIGAAAEELTPLVAKLAAEKTQGYCAHALYALGCLDPPASVVPVLVAGLEDERGQYNRMMAAQGLGRMGPRARAALPALHRALRDPDAMVRVHTAGAVWQVGRQAKDVMPVLIAALTESRGDGSRQQAIGYLKGIGPPAREAFPALLAVWKESTGYERDLAAAALKAIDPTAFARSAGK